MESTVETTEKRFERIKRAQEVRKALAERQDARVVFARTRDTSGLLLLIQSGDIAINRLRRGLGISVDFETGTKAIETYKNAIVGLAKAVKEVCDIMDVEFRAPAWIEEALGIRKDDGGE